MAYTKTPEQSTYSSARIPACYGINLRPRSALEYSNPTGITQDEGMINLIPKKEKDTQGNEIQTAVTRAPFVGAVVSTSSGEVARGCYVWEKTSTDTYYFSVAGTKIYTSTTGLVGSWTAVTTWTTNATTPVGFTEFIDSTNTKKLVIVDGVEGYVFTSNAAGTKITDADFPTPHIPNPVFIDGYLFLAKANTGDIYNSNLNDPALWTAGDFISSELYPDDIQALAKVNNYLLAIGKNGSEYFYDAANATGSPLARYEGGNLPFGTYFPYTLATNKNTVILLANNNDGEASLRIIEDFKHKDITPPWLVSLINGRLIQGTYGTTAAKLRACFVRVEGELLYILCLENGTISGSSCQNPTFAYSFSTGLWTEFRCLTVSGSLGSAVSMPLHFSSTGGKANPITFIQGYIGNYTFFGTFGANTANGTTSTAFDLFNGTGGFNTPIYTEIRTPLIDNDTLNRKTNSRFGVKIKQNTSSSTTIQVSWSDNDYQSYSSDYIVDVRASVDFPFVTQLGQYRQRTYRVRTFDSIFYKFYFFEIDINKGQQ